MSKIDDLAKQSGDLPGARNGLSPARGPALPPLQSGVEPPLLTNPVNQPGTPYVEPPVDPLGAPGGRAYVDGAKLRAAPALPPLGSGVAPAMPSTLPGAPGPQFVDPPAPAAPPASPISQAGMNEMHTVPVNPRPSAPANNPIENPNVRSVRTGGGQRSGVMSAEAADFQASGAGNKIPDQVGNLKLNPVPPEGVPPEGGWKGPLGRARTAGNGPAVPNMPPPVEPVGAAPGTPPPPGTPPETPPGTPPETPPGGATPAATGGPIANFVRGASAQAKAALPLTKLAISNPILNRTVGAARWIEPAIEANRVAKVALDPKSDGYDVANQTATGVGRAASTIAGAGIGGQAGLVAAPFLGPLAPAGPVVGSLIGGAAGYLGGDQAIRKLRGFFGLDESSPSERVDQRAAAARKAAPAAPAASPIGQAAQQAAGAAPQLPTMPTSGAAPGVAAPPAVDSRALAAHYNALQDEQLASPIKFTMFGSNGTEVYYKDGRVGRLVPGEALPPEVARYNDLANQLHALRNGEVPAGLGAPPAAQPGQAAPLQSAQAAPAGGSEIQNRVVAEAQRQGYDPRLALAKMSLETGGTFDPTALNRKSSAFGVGQMIAKNRAAYGTDEQWKDPAFQIASSIDFMKKNDADLAQRIGHAPSPTESYLGHLLGPTGGAAVLRANPNTPIEQVVSSYTKDPKVVQQIVHNNDMAGLSAGEAVAKWDRLMQKHAAATGAQPVAPDAQAAVAPGASAVPGQTGGIPDQYPVSDIEGVRQYVDVPVPGGSFAHVPREVAQAGGTDLRGAAMDYLANQSEGIANAQNPTRGKLAERGIEAQAQIVGHQTAAQAEVEKARIAAAAGRQKFMDVRGGVDPNTYMPQGDRVFNTETEKWVDSNAQGPAQTLPNGNTPATARATAIAMAKTNPAQLALINQSLSQRGLAPLTDADLH